MSNFDDLSAYDVPFGKGEMQVDKMLGELDRQNYNGWLLIECGGCWKNTLKQKIEEVKQSINKLRNKQAAACTATELRARTAPVVGTSFLFVISRRGYSRAFPRQARIACGNNYLTVKIRRKTKITTRNHPHSERQPKKQNQKRQAR